MLVLAYLQWQGLLFIYGKFWERYYYEHTLSANENTLYVCSTDPFFGQGNSFHGTGGRGSKLAQMRYSLRVLKSVVSLYDDAVSLNLCDQGAISQLLGKASFLLLTVYYCLLCISLDTENFHAFSYNVFY